jgi:prevent-host-death family protein
MPQPLKFRNAKGEVLDLEPIAASRLKNAPGAIVDQAAAGRPVVVTKHDSPKVVIISFRDFEELARARELSLGDLEGRFEELLAGMQAPKAKRAVASAFNAKAEQYGRAAVAAARKNRKGRRAA